MEKQWLDNLFGRVEQGVFQVSYWDGSQKPYGAGSPSFTLSFHRKPKLRAIFKDPVLALGEAYMDGELDIEGDWDEVIRLFHLNRGILKVPAMGLMGRIRDRLPRSNSLAQHKKNIQHHYDLGNDFYSLWLDETMAYSCAYFQKPDDSLHQAQLQKIDHVLKKLALRPGERLLDIGSGWGWLILRAAQQYGVQAMGITLSREQYEGTWQKIEELGLDGRVEVKLMDYRTLAQEGQTFDKIASVGMFEHVGQANLPRFMEAVDKLLKPGGLALLHTITHTKETPVNAWIERYIFPGYIPSLREVIWLLPEYDFHPLDIESLRMHYAMTLDRWLEGFENHLDWVRERYGERFVRMWRLYLKGSAAAFRATGQNIHQILFSKGLNNGLPLTRQHIYT